MSMSKSISTSIVGQGIKVIIRAYKRRKAIHQLMTLESRILNDIGLLRSEIPTVVDGLLDTSTQRLTATQTKAHTGNITAPA